MSLASLKGKKVLLIAARFFGYENEISNRLRYWGAQVDYFDQRPSNSFMSKALIRINNRILATKILSYYTSIAKETSGLAYDFVLMISPEAVTKPAFLILRRTHTEAEFILYMWDSLKNKSRSMLDLLPLFDHRYSFDRGASESTGWHFQHRPLFFLKEYSELARLKEYEYDVTFVGTVHSDRYKILKRLSKQFKTIGLRYFFYMYFPSRFLYYIRRLFNKQFWGTTKKQFQFSPLRKEEVLDRIGATKVLIDIHHPQQTGLTMRTLEAVGARRKLITTNEDILNYDFFDPTNIAIIDRTSLAVDPEFFKREAVDLDSTVYDRYSIDGWIAEIFDGK